MSRMNRKASRLRKRQVNKALNKIAKAAVRASQSPGLAPPEPLGAYVAIDEKNRDIHVWILLEHPSREFLEVDT